MSDEIPTISEDEYQRYAVEAEIAMLRDAPPDATMRSLKDAREAAWAANFPCGGDEGEGLA